MTELHKRPYRHPNDKIAYRVDNWREYEQFLYNRGDIAIVTALTLRLLFRCRYARPRVPWLGFLIMMDLSLP